MPTIGRYEVERELGRGAMGIVYKAHDPRLERPVALKVIRLPEGISEADRGEFRERFLREARAAARLGHGGIVTVYDADDDPQQDAPFIAMEYVPGRSLRHLLDQQERLDLDRITPLVRQLASALGAAHRAGIVHRDVKPANLLLTEDDRSIKIADFGVARLSASELTTAERVLGSPAYIAPEQLRGGTVDARCDLFSLAVVLYEMLCGERPFVGDDLTELMYAVAHGTPVPITRRVSGLPIGLDAFFDCALAKKPEDRYRDEVAFIEAFEQAVRSGSESVGEGTMVSRPTPGPTPNATSSSTPSPGATWSGTTTGSGVEPPSYDPYPAANAPPIWRRKRPLVATGIVGLVLLLWAFFGGGRAHLHLDVKSTFRDATLELLIDGEQVYAAELNAPEPPTGTFGKLKQLVDATDETFEAWIRTDPGKHEIVARVLPHGSDEPYGDTVAVELDAGEKRRLKLVARQKQTGGRVSLKFD